MIDYKKFPVYHLFVLDLSLVNFSIETSRLKAHGV